MTRAAPATRREASSDQRTLADGMMYWGNGKRSSAIAILTPGGNSSVRSTRAATRRSANYGFSATTLPSFNT